MSFGGCSSMLAGRTVLDILDMPTSAILNDTTASLLSEVGQQRLQIHNRGTVSSMYARMYV